MSEQVTLTAPWFVIHESLTEGELNAMMAALDADLAHIRNRLAENERLGDLVRRRLLSLQVADAERE